jgi:hypothetical protein
MQIIERYVVLNRLLESLSSFWNLFLGLCSMAFLMFKKNLVPLSGSPGNQLKLFLLPMEADKKRTIFSTFCNILIIKILNKFARSSKLFRKFKSVQDKHNHWRRFEKGFHFLSLLSIFRWKKVYKLWHKARSKEKSLNKFWLRGKSDELNLNHEWAGKAAAKFSIEIIFDCEKVWIFFEKRGNVWKILQLFI